MRIANFAFIAVGLQLSACHKETKSVTEERCRAWVAHRHELISKSAAEALKDPACAKLPKTQLDSMQHDDDALAEDDRTLAQCVGSGSTYREKFESCFLAAKTRDEAHQCFLVNTSGAPDALDAIAEGLPDLSHWCADTHALAKAMPKEKTPSSVTVSPDDVELGHIEAQPLAGSAPPAVGAKETICSHRADFVACLQSALDDGLTLEDAKLWGVTMAVTVDGSGTVAAVSGAPGGSGPATELWSCCVKVVSPWRFPPQPTTKGVFVNFKVSFAHGFDACGKK